VHGARDKCAIFISFKEITMMRFNLGFTAVCVLGTALLTACAAPVQAQKLRDTGVCHLTNVKVQKVIYDGECRITQEPVRGGSPGSALITIRMGNADPFKFACRPDGSCLTGGTNVRMKDRGNGSARFRWEDFRLDVDAD
jgi:hypothetical protein